MQGRIALNIFLPFKIHKFILYLLPKQYDIQVVDVRLTLLINYLY